MKRILCGFCALLVAAASIQAQIVAQWTFETTSGAITGGGTSLSGIVPEVGTGFASGLHANSSTTWSSPSGNGSAHSFNASHWTVGDYFQFQTTTVGYNNIRLSYDQASSSTGPGRGVLQYSTDGSLFTQVGLEYLIQPNGTPNTTWNMTTYNPVYTFTYDLSGIPALNNAASVYFRIVDTQTISAGGGTVGLTGTDRIDNFTLAVVPEPQGLAVLGGLCLFAWRQLRRRQ
jgi:hypothetical protein